MNLQLRKFDMKWINDDNVVVLIGKRETGKSFLAKDLMFHHRDIPIGVVISGTERANRFYSKIIPPIFIYDEFNPTIVNNFLKRQKNNLKRLNEGDNTIDPRAILNFDDCLYDNTWQRDKHVREIFMNGRHYKILFILTMQFALGIPPNLRTNIDWVFILRENLINNRKRIYEHYTGMFPTFETFCSTMDQCTENYECLVIHNNAKSNKIEDQVFWYKAEPHKDFRIGPQEIWDYSKENYVDDDDDDEININTYSKKRGPKLNVKKM